LDVSKCHEIFLWSWVQYDHLNAVDCVACGGEVSVFQKQSLRFHSPITFLPKWHIPVASAFFSTSRFLALKDCGGGVDYYFFED
jgi:hypothetical protein